MPGPPDAAGAQRWRSIKWQHLARWEIVLTIFLCCDLAINARMSPYFLNVWTLSDATFSFAEKAVVALEMALLVIAREIDISVSGTIALASVAMGLAAKAGLEHPSSSSSASAAD